MRAIHACWHLIPAPIRYFLGGTLGGGFVHVFRRNFNRHMDRHYGVVTIKPDLPPAVQTQFDDALQSVPSDYLRLLILRQLLPLNADDIFADIGSGTGRVIFVFAHTPCRQVRGIELDPIAIEECRANIATFRGPASKIKLFCADCASFQFTDETVLHFYNPFGPETLRAVLNNLHASVERNPRRVRLCYRGHFASVIDGEAKWLRLARTIKFRSPRMLIYESAGAVAPNGRP